MASVSRNTMAELKKKHHLDIYLQPDVCLGLCVLITPGPGVERACPCVRECRFVLARVGLVFGLALPMDQPFCDIDQWQRRIGIIYPLSVW